MSPRESRSTRRRCGYGRGTPPDTPSQSGGERCTVLSPGGSEQTVSRKNRTQFSYTVNGGMYNTYDLGRWLLCFCTKFEAQCY